MLESLTISNFQKHRKLTVQFDKGVTCIVGPSDAGKSAILRALRWVAFNKPSGDEFVKQGASRAKVILNVDGRHIKRRRGKGVNSYSIDGNRLKAFGSDVPVDITKLLAVDNINFQSQHDAPFWFSNTAGEVSRQLNEIVNLEIIDKTLASLNSMIRQNSAICEVHTNQLEAKNIERRQLKPYRSLDKDLQKVEELERKAGDIRLSKAELGILLSEHATLARTAEAGSVAAASGQLAIESGEAFLIAARKARSLRTLLEPVALLKQSADRKVLDIRGLDTLLANWKSARLAADGLRSLIEEAKRACSATERLRGEEKKLTAEFEKMRGPTCPMCGAKTK